MNEISKEKLRNFFSKYRLDKYKKKQLILEPGEIPNYVGFLKSGYVRVYMANNDGDEVTIQMFRPMFFFTLLFSWIKTENRYMFEAITPVELWKAPVGEVREFFKENPDVYKDIEKDFYERFIAITEQLSSGLLGKAKSKVAGALLSLYKTLKDESEQVAITHKLIASMTGMTRETVTLQMLKLEKEKVIDNKNRAVKVLDVIKLKKIAGSEIDYIDEN